MRWEFGEPNELFFAVDGVVVPEDPRSRGGDSMRRLIQLAEETADREKWPRSTRERFNRDQAHCVAESAKVDVHRATLTYKTCLIGRGWDFPHLRE
jgi:predicted GNAT superfamily acetyltransferase